MTEKYIYCPSCNTLTIHKRIYMHSLDNNVWHCEACNPPLEDFE